MKARDAGVLGAGLAGISLVLVVGQLMVAGWSRAVPGSLMRGFDAYATERLTVDPQAVSRMDLVEPTLPTLVQPQAVPADEVLAVDSLIDYAMFGHRSPPPAAPEDSAPMVASKPKAPDYHVAMTYVSGEHRYAVIDSKLYRQNSLLPSGEQLAEIAVGAVRVESASGARWIKIEGPGTG